MAQHILEYGAKTKAEVASLLDAEQVQLRNKYKGVLPEGMDKDVQGYFVASPASFLADLQAVVADAARELELYCELRHSDFREQAVTRKEQLRETIRSPKMERRNQKHLL